MIWDCEMLIEDLEEEAISLSPNGAEYISDGHSPS